jgi:hypothetical protein
MESPVYIIPLWGYWQSSASCLDLCPIQGTLTGKAHRGGKTAVCVDHCAFLRLAPIVNPVAIRRTIATNAIVPNSGIGTWGVARG